MDVQDPAEHVFDLCTGLKASMTVSLDDEDDPVGEPAITETPEVPRDYPFVRCGRNELPGDCGDVGGADRHGHVAVIAGEKGNA
jgi:hypothetical protein